MDTRLRGYDVVGGARDLMSLYWERQRGIG